MLIFVIIFLGVFQLAVSIFSTIFASIEAIETICAVLIFVSIAVAIFMKKNSAWAWMFIAVVAMASIKMLAPFESAIEIILSGIIATFATYQIKRPILAYLNRDLRRSVAVGGPRLPVWAHTLLRFI